MRGRRSANIRGRNLRLGCQCKRSRWEGNAPNTKPRFLGALHRRCIEGSKLERDSNRGSFRWEVPWGQGRSAPLSLKRPREQGSYPAIRSLTGDTINLFLQSRAIHGLPPPHPGDNAFKVVCRCIHSPRSADQPPSDAPADDKHQQQHTRSRSSGQNSENRNVLEPT